ncbi:unnamed protein product [Clonostachys chloroleuca]|uniref:Uncharacterized protein n=1 Tax=Clonostachys chloroleuca TaxID=1926264 RepID=A0AA35Q1U4_9HYPO|nr:unnamed protein product [Clonostachys chloroleuca]
MKLSFVALILASGALAAPTKKNKKLNIKKTDDLLFRTSLPDFIEKRNNMDPSTLNWDSDGCTSVPDKPLTFDFLPACFRHDFGFANYQAQDRFDDLARLKIDELFKEDLYHQCEKEKKTKRALCRTYANGYHLGARLLGDLNAKLAPKTRDLSPESLVSPEMIKKAWEDAKPALDKVEISRETYENLKKHLQGPVKKFFTDVEAQIGKERPTFHEVKNKIDQLVTVMGSKSPPLETEPKPKIEAKTQTEDKPKTEPKTKLKPKPKRRPNKPADVLPKTV